MCIDSLYIKKSKKFSIVFMELKCYQNPCAIETQACTQPRLEARGRVWEEITFLVLYIAEK